MISGGGSANLRDASTYTHTHTHTHIWSEVGSRVLENDVSSREIEKPLFETVVKVFLRICSLLSYTIDSFAFLSRRRERKVDDRKRIYFWKFVFFFYYENFLMWNCLIVVKRKDSFRIFIVKLFEIYFSFIILWILCSTLKNNCRVSVCFWNYFWIHKKR